MSSQDYFKKDYILIVFIILLYVLMVNSIILPFTNLICAVVVGLYFFPLKLFLGHRFPKYSKQNKAIGDISYFVISNIITLTALSAFLDHEGTIHSVIYSYGFINVLLLAYFYNSKHMLYHLLLTSCTTLLMIVAITL